MIAVPYELDEEHGMDCYVCMEPCLTLSPCKCTDLFLHEDCYAKLIAYNNFSCTVCRENYPVEIHEDEPDDIPDDEESPKNPTWCRILLPLQCRRHPEEDPLLADLYVNGLRHLIAIWIIACILNWLNPYDNRPRATIDVLEVFSWMHVGVWIFSGICYCFLVLIIQSIMRKR